MRLGQRRVVVSDIEMILAWNPASFAVAAKSWRGVILL